MNELPDYLQNIVDKAVQQVENGDRPISEIAVEIGNSNKHLTSNLNDDFDNLDVLKDLRDHDALCTDELDTYRNYALETDPDEATIEAIVIRSLEELIHNKLQETATP